MHEVPRSSRPRPDGLAGFLLDRDYTGLLFHIAFALFLACSLFESLYHVPWRDEAQAWLMARDLNVWQLFLEARHDGHPILWHLCLKALQAVGINYVGMMLLNWAFIGGAVWLLFYQSRLPLLARLSFAFCPVCLFYVSYYARNYAISAFLLFLAATLYRRAEKPAIRFAIVLALAASTNVYAAAVFVGASFQFLLEQGCSFGKSAFSLRPIYTRYLIPNAILALGALLVVLQLAPVPMASDHYRPEPFVAAASADQSKLVVLFHKLQHSRIFQFDPGLWIFLLLLLAILLFRKTPGAPRIYGIAVAIALALVPMTCYITTSRHLFVLVAGAVYFLWIYFDDIFLATEQPQDAQPKSPFLNSTAAIAGLVLALCLTCQHEIIKSVFVPDHDGRNAARAIRDHHLDEPGTLAVTTDPNRVTSVLLLLDHIPNEYAPPPWPAEPESFADAYYTRARKHTPTVAELKPLVLDFAKANPSKPILVIGCDPSDISVAASDPDYPLTLIYKSPPEPSDPNDLESYQVYVLIRAPTPAP